jgi:hypothetical protein
MDLPSDIGYMTINLDAIIALADSSDSGSEPDAMQALGTVTLTPTVTSPIWDYADECVILLSTITCQLTASGLQTLDGQPVNIVAPNQSALADQSWMWTLTAKPAKSQSWVPFTTTFTGKPGDEANIGNPALSNVAVPASMRPVILLSTQDASLVPKTAQDGDMWVAADSGEIGSVQITGGTVTLEPLGSIKGASGDVTPAAQAALAGAESAQAAAALSASQAQTFAATTQTLQDSAVSALVGTVPSATNTALMGRFVGRTIHHDFRPMADTAALSGVASDTGQVFYRPSSRPEWQVVSGRAVPIRPSSGTTYAYLGLDAELPLSGIGAQAMVHADDLGGGAGGNGFVLLLADTHYTNGAQKMRAHLNMGYGNGTIGTWSLTVNLTGSAFVGVASGHWAVRPVGEVFTVGVTLHADTATIMLPDGQVASVTDSRLTEVSATAAVWESVDNTTDSTGALTSFVDVWAVTDQAERAAGPFGLPDMVKALWFSAPRGWGGQLTTDLALGGTQVLGDPVDLQSGPTGKQLFVVTVPVNQADSAWVYAWISTPGGAAVLPQKPLTWQQGTGYATFIWLHQGDTPGETFPQCTLKVSCSTAASAIVSSRYMGWVSIPL